MLGDGGGARAGRARCTNCNALFDKQQRLTTTQKPTNTRLVEESDFRAARELFGGAGGAASKGGAALDAMLPKSGKDFEDYAAALTAR